MLFICNILYNIGKGRPDGAEFNLKLRNRRTISEAIIVERYTFVLYFISEQAVKCKKISYK